MLFVLCEILNCALSLMCRVFPKIDDSGKIGNKDLCREEQNKFSKKKLPSVGILNLTFVGAPIDF